MICSWPRLADCARLVPLCGLLALAGCASTLDVRTLATARADQSAFELTGRDLAALRREAGLLCPTGGEILRQTARDQRLEAADSRLERWVDRSSLWITQPERQAQMVVLCHPVADRHLLAATAIRSTTAVPIDAPAFALGATSAAAGVAASAAGSAAINAVPGASPSAERSAAPNPPSAPIGPLSVEW